MDTHEIQEHLRFRHQLSLPEDIHKLRVNGDDACFCCCDRSGATIGMALIRARGNSSRRFPSFYPIYEGIVSVPFLACWFDPRNLGGCHLASPAGKSPVGSLVSS